jgi:RNA polymerase sigma-70 factor (ECF subfamily)
MRTSPVDDPLAAGRAAWPGISVSPEIFATWVAERAPCAHVTDVYLACACAQGDAAALAAFERAFAEGVDAGLARLGATAAERDDVRAELAGKLFVGDAPAILDYRGEGELGRWLRAVAVRTWLNLRRRHGKERLAGDERLFDEIASPGDDPEIAHFKRRYRRELAECFADALTKLPDRDRALLRYHAVDGLTIDDIGAIYRVHRSTAFRWLEAARDRLSARTNALLERRLGLSGAQLASVLRLVRSQVDVSVRRLLAAPPPS